MEMERLLIVLALLAPVQAEDEALQTAVRLQDAFARVAEKVLPSVVCVTTYVRDEQGKPEAARNAWREAARKTTRYPGFKRLATGSGLVVRKEGLILCCRHILVKPDGELADVVDVETPDYRHTLSRVLATEPTLNLAVLKLEVFAKGRPPKFEPATPAKEGALRVGHWAIAVGDPFGAERFYATGIVAGLPERKCYQEQLSATYLQAALKIHPEAYGGPLVDIRGEVVGLTVPRDPKQAFASPHGLEFALPIRTAMGIFESLNVKRSFQSPWLGFAVLELAELRARVNDPKAYRALKRPLTGVYIDDVFDPGPASRAGIQVGDFVTKIDAQRLLSVLDFQKQLYLAGVGRTVTLEVFREGELIEKKVKVEARPKEARPR